MTANKRHGRDVTPASKTLRNQAAMSEELQDRIEALRCRVETRDLIIADLEREIRELNAMINGTYKEQDAIDQPEAL
jgi:predicted  nucleic acid-binding Zn-ribbon protein